MSFITELKNIIKADFSGLPLSDNSDLINIISKEITNTFKEKYNVSIKPNLATQTSDNNSDGILHKKKRNNAITTTSSSGTIQNNVINSNQLQGIADEIGKILLKQFQIERDKEKTRRKIFKIVEWTFTLLAGGIVGALIQKYLQ